MITPPRPPDFLDRYPGLAELGRTATRLHPRPASGTASPAATQSHIGGPLAWPVDEPWPVCETPRLGREDVPLPPDLVERLRTVQRDPVRPHVSTDAQTQLMRDIASFVGRGYAGHGSMNGHRYGPIPHPEPYPMVPLAQLRAADVPDLPRPGGADLLQVLWCPHHHAARPNGPTVALRWRGEVPAGPYAKAPAPGSKDPGYLPEPCRLHPEQVTDYPFHQELPKALRKVARGKYSRLAMAPGWKVGGHADWGVTDLGDTSCLSCSGPTRLLLQIDSYEYHSDTARWWRPAGDPDPGNAMTPTGVRPGRDGAYRIFVCLSCPDTPFRLDLQ
ncbi:hypothetical protein AB0M02_43950 [Actinoplanes sp. NPDC051861]|uniref:hypothetical protein n=1 Tax=Actinoplanes sp. NPDC051861 TaxID=3155170 RepID=UPI003412C610